MKQKFSLSEGLKIGVLYGGISSERKISLKSGKAVARGLSEAGLDVVLIDPALKNRMENALEKIDLAFIALHGRGGEDGIIQRILERKGLAYTGSDAKACSLTLNKVLSKQRLVQNTISTPAYCVINEKNWKKKIATLRAPVFIKPLCEGSSIGAFSVTDLKRGAGKIKRALKIYRKLLVEKKIEGREFTVGILGKRSLPVIELKPKRGFYDFKAKYTKGMTDYIVPARIPKSLAVKLQQIAWKTHRILGLRDMSRVDLMVDLKGKPYVLEANSIPGFTEFSLLPKAASADGIKFPDLCRRLVAMAQKRRVSKLWQNEKKQR